MSIVRYEWHVHSTPVWMNVIAPLVRSIFIHNHMLVMEQGGEGLARLLGSPLVSQENIDLMAEAEAPPPAIKRLQVRRKPESDGLAADCP